MTHRSSPRLAAAPSLAQRLRHALKAQRGFIVFMLCLGVFRTAVADWNPIPSGSMRPTLLEGDVVFVNRLAYDLKLPLTDVVLATLGEPHRGDVVTFSSPADGKRLIKRIVALPGDRVAMHDERLVINGETAVYDTPQAVLEPTGAVTPALRDGVRMTERVAGHTRRVQWLPEVPARRDFAEVTVPAGQWLVLGDNRDDSADSRYIGFIPREKLIGRAERVLVSLDYREHIGPRWSRWGAALSELGQ
jgi:signal peptidase I